MTSLGALRRESPGSLWSARGPRHGGSKLPRGINDASVCDNLNRATTISGTSRTYDILGNTLTIGTTKSMGWDELNRMTSFVSGSNTTDYAYRADGMRVSKAAGTQTVTYGYDGQMSVEECLTDSSNSSNNYTTRYGIGLRGIERLETTNSSGTSVGYPIYDAHGNLLTTLAKSGAGYSYGGCRIYDAWGGIRSGATTGSPNGRYCANLGHVQDDESGLLYMRSRSYDPVSGRYLREDTKRDGWNWFAYCENNPVNLVDSSGCGAEILWGALACFLVATLFKAGVNWAQTGDPNFGDAILFGGLVAIVIAGILAVAGASVALGAIWATMTCAEQVGVFLWMCVTALATGWLAGGLEKEFNLAEPGMLGRMIRFVTSDVYGEQCWAALLIADIDSE